VPSDFETDILNGVFLSISGVETRASVYVSDGATQITCVVPSSVIGPIDIIVRSDYGGPNLREGTLSSIPQV
jgi:hypothetical protein